MFVDIAKLSDATELLLRKHDLEEDWISLALGILEDPRTGEPLGTWNIDRVDELARILSELLDEKSEEDSPNPVRFSGHIAESDVNAFASRMLEACLYYQTPPPVHLVHLIVRQMKVGHFTDYKERTRRDEAKDKAIEFLAKDPNQSLGSVAKYAGVNKTTVMRWLEDRYFVYRVCGERMELLWATGSLKEMGSVEEIFNSLYRK